MGDGPKIRTNRIYHNPHTGTVGFNGSRSRGKSDLAKDDSKPLNQGNVKFQGTGRMESGGFLPGDSDKLPEGFQKELHEFATGPDAEKYFSRRVCDELGNLARQKTISNPRVFANAVKRQIEAGLKGQTYDFEKKEIRGIMEKEIPEVLQFVGLMEKPEQSQADNQKPKKYADGEQKVSAVTNNFNTQVVADNNPASQQQPALDNGGMGFDTKDPGAFTV